MSQPDIPGDRNDDAPETPARHDAANPGPATPVSVMPGPAALGPEALEPATPEPAIPEPATSQPSATTDSATTDSAATGDSVATPAAVAPAVVTDPTGPRRLTRSRTDRMLGGVCGGLADYFGWDSTWVRVAFVVSVVLPGPQFLLYLLLWVVIPRD